MACLGCLVGFMAETLIVCTEISLKLVVSRANIHWHLGHRTRGKFPVDLRVSHFQTKELMSFPFSADTVPFLITNLSTTSLVLYCAVSCKNTHSTDFFSD